MRFTPLAALALAACTAAPAAEMAPPTFPPVEVIDGDTLKIDGETIRIANIDTPEMGGRAGCWAEARLATEAKFALELETTGWASLPPSIERDGQDRYGRTLATIRSTTGKDLGQHMIDAGLAVPWTGRRFEWCGPVTDASAGVDLLRTKPNPVFQVME